jgi:hypothetical protein
MALVGTPAWGSRGQQTCEWRGLWLAVAGCGCGCSFDACTCGYACVCALLRGLQHEVLIHGSMHVLRCCGFLEV